MANPNAPFGFIPVRHLMGGTVRSNAIGTYFITSGYATSIFTGDVVQQINTGPYVTRAANNSSALAGVFAGVQFINPLDSRPWWSDMWIGAQVTVSAADAAVYLIDDPNVVFQVQALTGTAVTATMVGNNAPLDATAGSALTRHSAEALNVSTTATTTDQFRILGLAPILGNALGDSAILEVKFNQHILIGATGV